MATSSFASQPFQRERHGLKTVIVGHSDSEGAMQSKTGAVANHDAEWSESRAQIVRFHQHPRSIGRANRPPVRLEQRRQRCSLLSNPHVPLREVGLAKQLGQDRKRQRANWPLLLVLRHPFSIVSNDVPKPQAASQDRQTSLSTSQR